MRRSQRTCAFAGWRNTGLQGGAPSLAAAKHSASCPYLQAGPEHRFATGQLMCVAANCMDFTDATGRAAASTMLHSLLTEVPASKVANEGGEEWTSASAGPWTCEAWRTALALFLRKVYGSPAELADALLGVLGELHAAAGFGADAPAPPSEAAWLHALGVAGLLLGQLPSARAALAASSPFTLGDALHCLVQPGLRQRSTAVRCEAARCLGLYCLLGDIPSSLASHVRVLRALLVGNEVPGVRAVAAQVRAACGRAWPAAAASLPCLARSQPLVGHAHPQPCVQAGHWLPSPRTPLPPAISGPWGPSGPAGHP